MNGHEEDIIGKKIKVKCKYLAMYYDEDESEVEILILNNSEAKLLCSFYRKGGYCAIRNRVEEVDDDDLWHECGIMSGFLEENENSEEED